MPLPPSQPSTCAQCGQPLKPGQAAVGCLHCLLGEIGGPDEATVLRDSPQPPATDAGTRYHHYEVLRREDGTALELGRGGMGVTYKAVDVNLRVPVALKVIDADYARHPRARELFLREARSAARLRHPNVATVYHFGTLEPAAGGSRVARGRGTGGRVRVFTRWSSWTARPWMRGCAGPGRCRRVRRWRSPCRSPARWWQRKNAASCTVTSSPPT